MQGAIEAGGLNRLQWCEEDRVGILRLKGNDALDLLHRLSAGDLKSLKDGESRAAPLLTEKGRIIDILVICRPADHILVLVSIDRLPAVMHWLEKYTITEDIQAADATAQYQITWVYRPEANSLPTDGPASPGFHRLTVPHFASDRLSWIIQERLEGGLGNGLPSEGQVDGAQRDLVSTLLGVPGAPAELNEHHTPYDLNLRHLISFTKGCYIGQEVIARLDTYGKAHRGMMLVTIGSGDLPDAPARVFKGGGPVGMLTSIARKKAANVWFGLAVLDARIVSKGDVLDIEGGNSLLVNDFPLQA